MKMLLVVIVRLVIFRYLKSRIKKRLIRAKNVKIPLIQTDKPN